jgi:formate--tetrahydrofolate ligase
MNSRSAVPMTWRWFMSITHLDVDRVFLSAGAGFVVEVCGEIMLMPGLPRTLAAESIDIDADGNISGLF